MLLSEMRVIERADLRDNKKISGLVKPPIGRRACVFEFESIRGLFQWVVDSGDGFKPHGDPMWLPEHVR